MNQERAIVGNGRGLAQMGDKTQKCGGGGGQESSKDPMGLLSTELSNPFNTQLLIAKREALNFDINLINLISHYLTGRKPTIKIDFTISSCISLKVSHRDQFYDYCCSIYLSAIYSYLLTMLI